VHRWCREAGHRLGRTIYRDEGRSGTLESADRPGLADALTEIEGGTADGIIAPTLDRFARTLVVQEAILAQIWKHGGRAFTTDTGEVHPDDPDDPMRTAHAADDGHLRSVGTVDDRRPAPPWPSREGERGRVRLRRPALRLASPPEGTHPGGA
jgi:hypothetical protein